MVASWYGVPVVLVTGDDIAVKQVAEVAQNVPTMTRPAPDTITFTSDSMATACTLIRLLYRYINPD